MSWAPHHSKAIQGILSGAAAVSALCCGAGAQAAEYPGSWARESALTACGTESNDIVPRPAGPIIQIAVHASKSAAILGGQPSALELIRMAQQPDGRAAS